MADARMPEEPGASTPHAGICAGAVGSLAVLPRWPLRTHYPSESLYTVWRYSDRWQVLLSATVGKTKLMKIGFVPSLKI